MDAPETKPKDKLLHRFGKTVIRETSSSNSTPREKHLNSSMCLSSSHLKGRAPLLLDKNKTQQVPREAAENENLRDHESPEKPGGEGLFFDYSSLSQSSNLDQKLKASRSRKNIKPDALNGPIFEVEEAFEGEGCAAIESRLLSSKHPRREPQSPLQGFGSKQFYLPHHKKLYGRSEEDRYWCFPPHSTHLIEDSASLKRHHKLFRDSSSHQSAERDFFQNYTRDISSAGSSSNHKRNPSLSKEDILPLPNHSQPTLSVAQSTSNRKLHRDPNPSHQDEPKATFSTSPNKRSANLSRRTNRFDDHQTDLSSLFQKKLPKEVVELPEEEEVSKTVIEESGHTVSKNLQLQLPISEGARLSNSIPIPSEGGAAHSSQSAFEAATPMFNKGRDINLSFGGTRKGSEFQVSLIQLERGDNHNQDLPMNEASCLNINIQTPAAIKNLNINNFPGFSSRQSRNSRKNTPRLSKEL